MCALFDVLGRALLDNKLTTGSLIQNVTTVFRNFIFPGLYAVLSKFLVKRRSNIIYCSDYLHIDTVVETKILWRLQNVWNMPRNRKINLFFIHVPEELNLVNIAMRSSSLAKVSVCL
jgi:hypothetical protein